MLLQKEKERIMRRMNTNETFILRSATLAMKAKRILAEHGISVNVVKRTSANGDGCVYGISVARTKADVIPEILGSAGIEVTYQGSVR